MSAENLTAAGKAEFEKTGVMPTETLIANERVMPDEMARELRRWAIERAIAADLSCYPDIGEAARAFVDFVMVTNDAEIVRAARELADKVKG